MLPENQYKPARFQMTLDQHDSVRGHRYFYMEFPNELTPEDVTDIREYVSLALRRLERFATLTSKGTGNG